MNICQISLVRMCVLMTVTRYSVNGWLIRGCMISYSVNIGDGFVVTL